MTIRHTVQSAARCGAAGAVLAAGVAAHAGAPVQWTFDEATEGDDVFWDSPTAVSSGAPRYESMVELTRLDVNVRLAGGLELGPLNVTNEIPKEFRVFAAPFPGPLPQTLVDLPLIFPEPPEPTTFAGTLALVLDASGFGHLSLTDIVLGTATVDLGFPFGVQTVTITRVRVQGAVMLDPNFCPADLDGDGAVTSSDLAIILGSWNTDDPTADINLDGTVNSSDLATVLGSWGPCAG